MIKIPHHGAKDNNKGLANFARNHGTREFIVTCNEDWNEKHPSEEILQELDAIGESTNEIVIHTHTDLSKLGEFEHTKIDKNDTIEWRNGK